MELERFGKEHSDGNATSLTITQATVKEKTRNPVVSDKGQWVLLHALPLPGSLVASVP